MGWGYDLWTWERSLKAADYSYKAWEASPMMQRWFAMAAAGAKAAADAKLAAAIAQVRTASMVAGAGSLAVTLVIPLAVWVGVFAALGAGYAEAVSVLKTENFKSGFTQGTVTGLLKWEWSHTTSRFFKFSPDQSNGWIPGMGTLTANAYNQGLRAGFLQGAGYHDDAKKELLKQLRTLSPTTKKGNWDRLDQVAYVIELAVAGMKGGIFKT